MQNLENLDVFDILMTQKLLKCPKDPFVRSALIYFDHKLPGLPPSLPLFSTTKGYTLMGEWENPSCPEDHSLASHGLQSNDKQ